MIETGNFKVGEIFPFPVPKREGASLELWDGPGFVLAIQMPNLKKTELEAFHKGFDQYIYLEWPGEIPIAFWIFDFPLPHGRIEGNFNARVVKNPALIERRLDTSEGVKNLITFLLLDGQILKGMRASGLELESMEMFYSTIRKQLALNYSEADFVQCLAGIYQNYTTDELFSIGVQFKHRREFI